MNDFIVDAIFSFGEAMNVVKSPKNEEEYKQFATPFPDKKITKTWVEVKNKSDALEADWNALEYSRKRQEEYPDFGTQLNKIYDDGIEKWKSEMVDPIKAKYPKPE